MKRDLRFSFEFGVTELSESAGTEVAEVVGGCGGGGLFSDAAVHGGAPEKDRVLERESGGGFRERKREMDEIGEREAGF